MTEETGKIYYGELRKMTAKEALKILSGDFLDVKLADGESHADVYAAAFKMACEALEKQVPRKPVDVEDKMWCCPSCYNNLLYKWVKYPEKLMPKSSGLPYCMSCGKAIDWSEDES